ncbi:MAG: ARPP-1 family domain-containing protein [Desulfobacteraceae bacterium]
MKELIKDFLAGIKVGEEQSFKNLAVFALHTEQPAAVEFITLDEALAEDCLTITEVDESGLVTQLKVANNSRHKVLMMDGEELVGAKQNRVLNVTILLAPNSETVIPVSCIEQGRWAYTNRKFCSAERTMNADLRRKKAQAVHCSLRHSGAFASDQGEIWDEIDLKFARCHERLSPTRALSDLFEAKKESIVDYLKHFTPVAGQSGMAVFIDGALAGIEWLGRADKFQQLYRKLITSYILDALETADLEPQADSLPSADLVSHYLAQTALAQSERRKSISLGWDLRLDSEVIVGAGLVFDNQLLQLSLFPQAATQKQQNERTLRRASWRRGSILR